MSVLATRASQPSASQLICLQTHDWLADEAVAGSAYWENTLPMMFSRGSSSMVISAIGVVLMIS